MRESAFLLFWIKYAVLALFLLGCYLARAAEERRIRGELPWMSAPHCLCTSERNVTEGEKKRRRRKHEKKMAALKRAR